MRSESRVLALVLSAVPALAQAEGEEADDAPEVEPDLCAVGDDTKELVTQLRTGLVDQAARTAWSQAFDAVWDDAPYCQRTAIVALVTQDGGVGGAALLPELEQELATLDAQAKQAAYEANGCTVSSTLCVDKFGRGFRGDSKDSAEEGEDLAIKVLSAEDADKAEGRVRVVLNIGRSLDTPTKVAVNGGGAAAGGPPDGPEYAVVASGETGALASDARVVRVSIEKQNPADAEEYDEVGRVEIAVRHGRYFFEFGLALPVLYKGTREVVSPSTIEERTAPRGAITAIYFPGGRAKGEIDYLREPSSAFGIAVATDVDFTTFEKDYHLGVAWSPIAGLALSLGLSLVPGEFLAYPEVSPPVVPADMFEVREHMILRPYFGLFATTELLTTASTALTDLRGVPR
jgi:hypothetical protein